MKRYRVLAASLSAALLIWGGYFAYRAHANLVTLNVRDMDVRRAISKIEWQTWERIVVNKDVAGTVTLNVKDAPLADVLNIVALQTASRWTALYPIYSTSKSAVALNKVIRGETPAAASGWSNIEKIPAARWGGMSGFGNTARAANNLVSADISGKDLGFAALALSRYSRALVVPEDGANGTITLKLEQAPFDKAVAQVARQVHRKWDHIYTLQTTRKIVANVTNSVPGEVTNQVATAPVVLPKEEDPKARERQLEAFLATMTPEERKNTEEQIAKVAQIQSLPEAERQQQMQQMAAQAQQASRADLERRIQARLRDGTTAQRIAHDREVLKRRQQRAQTP